MEGTHTISLTDIDPGAAGSGQKWLFYFWSQT